MREPEKGKVYCLIRQVEQGNRMIAASRRVRVLEAAGKQVMVDNGDGTRSEISAEAFREMAREDAG